MSLSPLLAKTQHDLQVVWDRWRKTLPLDAETWPRGAAYVRESGADSLVGGAPAGQLESTLAMFGVEGVFVDWEDVYFDNVSGTAMAGRGEFKRLIGRCASGRYSVIGAYLPSRFFRNVEEAIAVKRQLNLLGVRLTWVGKPTMDPRDPSMWMMDRQTEVSDEWPARQTGWLVGRSKERLSREGAPTGGRQLEVWRVAERGPGRPGGRRGIPTKWELVEPIASVVKEAVQRYLDGDSFEDLAAWALTTACAGVTPAGRPMDRIWFRGALQNPKLAGFQHVSDYMGFKPGKESPKPRPRAERELVACVLPPLITLAQHRALLAVSMQRIRGAARYRRNFRTEMISGVARDASCRHTLHVRNHVADEFNVRCGQRSSDRHGRFFRARDASDQLDALIGSMHFDDPAWLELIQEHLDAAAASPKRTVASSPEVDQLRSALVAVDPVVLPDLHADLSARLAEAEVRFAPREANDGLSFSGAIEMLKEWKSVWGSASARDKNALLRAAGLIAYIEPIDRKLRKRAPVAPDLPPHSRLVAVEIAVPEFALAFAAVTDLAGASAEVDPSSSADAPQSATASKRKKRRAERASSPEVAPPVVYMSTRHRRLLKRLRGTLVAEDLENVA